jgi:hypothetical protein
MHFVAQSLKPQPARNLGHGIKLAPQQVGTDHYRDGQTLHSLCKLKQRIAMCFNSFIVEVDSENRLGLTAREAFYFQRMSQRNPRQQRTSTRRAEQRDWRIGRQRHHVVFQISSSKSRVRRLASHALAAAICSSGSLVSSHREAPVLPPRPNP